MGVAEAPWRLTRLLTAGAVSRLAPLPARARSKSTSTNLGGTEPPACRILLIIWSCSCETAVEIASGDGGLAGAGGSCDEHEN